MSELESVHHAVIKGDAAAATAATSTALEGGHQAKEILEQGLIAAMDKVGARFAKGQIFVPQMLRSAKTMQACIELLKPHFGAEDAVSKGLVVIGTVKGDLHDIGKNLVAMMLEGAGFAIRDLGVDVPADRFVQAVQETEPQIVAMSALLSTTMPAMRATVEALTTAEVREGVKVMIGGAPVTEKFAREIGADAYAPEAGTAVTRAKALLEIA